MGADLKIVKAVKAIYTPLKFVFGQWESYQSVLIAQLASSKGSTCRRYYLSCFLIEQLNSNNNFFDDNSDIIGQFQKFILLFADDTFLLAESKPRLLLLLNKLCMYYEKRNFTVNTNKTIVNHDYSFIGIDGKIPFFIVHS